MRLAVLILVSLVVIASGCSSNGPAETPDDQEPVEDQPQDNQEDDGEDARTYAGANPNAESASGQLDYTDEAEIAANPKTPNATATHAVFLRVPFNHEGDTFQDFWLRYEAGDASGVTPVDVRTIVLDIGVNDTLTSPGPEDFVMEAASVEVSSDGREMVIKPVQSPEYTMTSEDRVMVEFTGVKNPPRPKGYTVNLEINSEDTGQYYEPARPALQIG